MLTFKQMRLVLSYRYATFTFYPRC